ncbi:putative serine protease K12H4.7 [Ctenocephalides felis]|uniref:putative serine protease K12H4.7 n=1 Tax=Ctenocephalides felis TaxID=7515 RepID=UPI000E6E105C|nr:putative serine protease K12H4.7 [Ctenocephalides felis]
MNLPVVLVLALGLLCSDVSGFFSLRSRKTREPVEFVPKSRHNVQTLWVTQKLDHFNPHDNRTWEMRYMSNDEHFKAGGPIIIYIGGEWTISAGALVGGQQYDIAVQHNGYLFYTEHRYYGSSHPTPDASTKNLQYLSVDQSLADLAYFVDYVKSQITGAKDSKVIVVGGSYAGSMAAWFRLKYPHQCDIALSSSAPLLAVADFYKYHEVVGKALKSESGDICYQIVEEGMKQLREVIKTTNGPQEIAQLFNLCTAINPRNALDYGTLVSGIEDVFAGIVQYHKPGDIEGACDILQKNTDAANGSELKGLAALMKSNVGWGSSQCAEADYLSMVNAFKQVSWGSSSTTSAMRQWFYQTCTEYGYYQTDSSPNQPYGSGINTLPVYIQLCKDLYEDVFTDNAEDILNTGIERTNVVYGALTSAVDKVIFTHGTVDPWHSIGLLEEVNPESPVIVVKGTSHCKDLQSISSADSAEMKAAKKRVLELVAKWLSE